MNSLALKSQNLARRKMRIRSKVQGNAKRPRLTVYVSNVHVSAQLVDDSTNSTVLSVSTIGQKFDGKNMTEKAVWVGEQVASKAKTAKIKQIVFDRNGKKYHGRIKALADAARQGGLEF